MVQTGAESGGPFGLLGWNGPGIEGEPFLFLVGATLELALPGWVHE